MRRKQGSTSNVKLLPSVDEYVMRERGRTKSKKSGEEEGGR